MYQRPMVRLERLMKWHTCRLKFEEEWLGVIDCDGCCEQVFSVPKFGIDLRVGLDAGYSTWLHPGTLVRRWRLAIDEGNREA